jgi:hypothetical protein
MTPAEPTGPAARRGALALLAAAGVSALAACERTGPATEQYWAQQKAAAERLDLWSMEAVGTGAPPVRVCTDVAIRAGLARPAPAVGDTPCTRLGRPVETDATYAFRCELGDREWAVNSYWNRDRGRDFTVEMTVSSLDDPRVTYAQTRRYRKLGACPAGWVAGDTRDRQGRRLNALEPWPASTSPPP